MYSVDRHKVLIPCEWGVGIWCWGIVYTGINSVVEARRRKVFGLSCSPECLFVWFGDAPPGIDIFGKGFVVESENPIVTVGKSRSSGVGIGNVVDCHIISSFPGWDSFPCITLLSRGCGCGGKFCWVDGFLAGTTLEFAVAVCFAAEKPAGELHRKCWASSPRYFYISGFGGQSA